MALTAAACGDTPTDDSVAPATTAEIPTTTRPAPPEPRELRIDASDFAFALPDTVPSGLTRVMMTNSGRELHQVSLARLEPDQTRQDFLDAFLSKLDPAGVATMVGGPNGGAPGDEVSALVDLQPGHYVVGCFIPSPSDGLPHILKDMVAEFDVVGEATPVAFPPSDATIGLRDFLFENETDLTGIETVLVENRGAKIHELALVQFDPSTTELADVVGAIDIPIGAVPPDPLPYTDRPGLTILSPGARAWLDIGAMRLEPGHYALVCFVPDLAEQHAHAALGMISEFDIE